jgi:hypothetical protein
MNGVVLLGYPQSVIHPQMWFWWWRDVMAAD